MKAIDRRLRRLEERFGPHVETEYERQLLARIEAGRRRVAESRERGEGSGFDDGHEPKEDLTGLTVEQILLRGRARNARG